jgi:hypothetical protein
VHLTAKKGRKMYCMSEHEKYEQVGRLAEEYSELKGHLAHVQEKLSLAQQDYVAASQGPQGVTGLRVMNGKLVAGPSPQSGNRQRDLEHLLNSHQLIEVLEERNRLQKEIAEKAARLKALAPHLL